MLKFHKQITPIHKKELFSQNNTGVLLRKIVQNSPLCGF